MMKMPEVIDNYKILNLIKETDKACFYLCCDNAEEHWLLKVYKKNRKSRLSSLMDIKHPNAVEVIKEGFVFDSYSYMNKEYEIMAYLEAATTLCENMPVKENEVFEIIRQLAECLNVLHQKGFVHRNVTPENILMNGNEPILISYGFVTEIDLQDNVEEVLTKVFKQNEDVTGTEGFIAPEVYSGIISPAVDYFSLGMTLFYLLTGRKLSDKKENKNYKKGLFTGSFIDDVNRTAVLTVRQKQIICGLITLQHDKRWGYEELTRFFNGDDVAVYSDWNPPEPFVFGWKRLFDLKSIADELLKHPVYGARIIKNKKFTNYLVQLGLNKKAEQINNLIENKQASYSSSELCSVVYLTINDMKYKICDGKELKTKEDFYSLSEQLKKRVEYLVLSKKTLFCMWLSVLFEVNLSDFYSELNREDDFERFIAINEKRNKEGLWLLLIQFLNDKKIIIDVKPLPDAFFMPNLRQIIKKTACDEFRKKGSLFLVRKNDKYTVYNLTDCNRIFKHTFSDITGFVGGYILYNGKREPYVVIQKGRKPFVQKLNDAFEYFLNVEDYSSLNKLISLSFEYFHLNGDVIEKRKILDYINENHIEDLSAFAKLYYSLLQYEKRKINTYDFTREIKKICDEISKNPDENSYLVINELGKIYYQLDMKDEAMKCFEQGISLDINKKLINEIAIALMLYEQKKYKDAVAYFKLCLNERPESVRGNGEIFTLYSEACSALGLPA